MTSKTDSLTLMERMYRRLAPAAFKQSKQRQSIARALAAWGGANLPADHPLWREAMFKRQSGLKGEIDVRFNAHAGIPILVRPGTADPNPFRQVFLEQQYDCVRAAGITPHTILDLGANVGYSAVWFAMRYPHAKICAVEPLPANVERIRRQIGAAGLSDRVQIIQAAADAAPGQAEFYTYEDGFFHTSGSLIADESHRVTAAVVECVTIPQLIARAGWDHADMIKIDIEGAETRLLTVGADVLRPVLESTRVFPVELHTPEAAAAADTFFAGWERVQLGETTCFYRAR